MTSRDFKGGLMALGFLSKYRDAGLFLLRLGIGIAFIIHGWGKMAYPEKWPMIGGALSAIGFTPSEGVAKAFGLMAGIIEFGGGICLILGFLFRPACILLASVMAVALTMHVRNGDPFVKYSHALESLILFVSLVFIGPGKVSVVRD